MTSPGRTDTDVRDRTPGAWLVLGSATALGVAALLYYLLVRPGTVGLDFRVYHVAAETALAGGDFYAVSPADSGFQYLYPPVTVLAFLPAALFDGWLPGFLLHTAVSLAATGLAARALLDALASLGHRLPRSERLLVGAFLAVSVHAAPSLVFGQVNHLVVAALVAGLAALFAGRERAAGIALAVPAYVKIIPGAVGLYLLRRRAWRAIAAAAGTAAALTAVGLVVFGVDASVTYVVDALLPRREAAAFAGGLDPAAGFVTLRRPLSVLFPAVDPTWYAVGAAALLLPALAVLYWRVETATDRLVAVHGTLVVAVLAVPSLLVYYAFLAFPLVALLYDLPAGRARRLFLAGATLANLSVAYGGVRRLLAALPLDPGTAGAVAEAVRPLFRLGTPVLWGSLLTLAGCLGYALRER